MAAMSLTRELDDAVRRLQVDPYSPSYCIDDAARAYKAMAEVLQRRQKEEMEEERAKIRRELEQRAKNLELAARFHAAVFEPDPSKRAQQGDEDWELVESPNQRGLEKSPAPPPPTPATHPSSPSTQHASPSGIFVLDENDEDFMGVE